MAITSSSGNLRVVLPVILAGIGVFLLFLFIRAKEAELGLSAELVPVVVAKHDIPAFSKVDQSLFTIMSVPRKFVQPASIKTLEDVDQRVSIVPILKGIQVTETMFADKRKGYGLALKISRGYRAVSLGFDEVKVVSGLVSPGDRVDVFGTFTFGSAVKGNNSNMGKNLNKKTFLLIEDLVVLAIGKDMGTESLVKEAALADNTQDLKKRIARLRNEGSSGGKRSRGSNSASVTFLASPTQVQELILARSSGDLTLALRPAFGKEDFLDLEPLDAKAMLDIEEELYMPRPWGAVRGTERY